MPIAECHHSYQYNTRDSCDFWNYIPPSLISSYIHPPRSLHVLSLPLDTLFPAWRPAWRRCKSSCRCISSLAIFASCLDLVLCVRVLCVRERFFSVAPHLSVLNLFYIHIHIPFPYSSSYLVISKHTFYSYSIAVNMQSS